MTTVNHKLAVAPMMDYTDRHFRYLLRLLSPSAVLYTEMVNAQAVIRGDRERLLGFDPSEHPLVLQLGGSEPAVLAEAARIAADFGYDEINLNCGCPSDRVKSGRFGACLMSEPERVAECVAAMQLAAKLPVSVKCRIAIEPRVELIGSSDDAQDYEFLSKFVATVAAAGCRSFVVHARTALLDGLSPKENREIPPLRYHLVEKLSCDYPDLRLIVNGGIRDTSEVQRFLGVFDGVMLGREICQNPYRLAELHHAIYSAEQVLPSRDEVLLAYADYVDRHWQQGERLASMFRHALNLYFGRPGGRSYRRFISERASLASSTPDVLRQSLRIVQSVSSAA
jgi:tRNA-dihydrouridine synthase A